MLRPYYSDYKGSPQEFISSAKWGFLYQGQHSCWQEQPRGTFSFDLPPESFINFLRTMIKWLTHSMAYAFTA
jgi:maltooligosyltrehalose trehalohydrolase